MKSELIIEGQRI